MGYNAAVYCLAVAFPASVIFSQSPCDQYKNKFEDLISYRKQAFPDSEVLKKKASDVLKYMEPCYDSRPTTNPEKQVSRLYLLGRVHYDASQLAEARYFFKKCLNHKQSHLYKDQGKTYRELADSLYSATRFSQTSPNRGASGSVTHYSGKGGYVEEITKSAIFEEALGKPFTSLEIEDFAKRKIKLGSLSESDLDAIKKRADSEVLDYLDPFIVVNGGASLRSEGQETLSMAYNRTGIARDTAEGLLRFYKHLKNKLGLKAPDYYITIYLDKSPFSKDGYSNFSEYAKDIHYRPAGGRVAYYNPMDQSVVCWITTGRGTLNHEVVHALVHQDFPEIPAWLNEGIGAMYEETKDQYTAMDNYRITYLKAAIKKGVLPDVRTLVTADDPLFDASKETMLYAAAARYLVMYFNEAGKLSQLYQSLRSKQNLTKETQLALLLEVAETSESQLNAAWLHWLSKRSTPSKWESLKPEIRDYISSISSQHTQTFNPETIRVHNSAVYDGNRGDRSWYKWTIYVTADSDTLNQIDFVEYELHPTFRNPIVKVYDNRLDGFPLTRTGWGVFKVKVSVHFMNGDIRKMKHQLKFNH